MPQNAKVQANPSKELPPLLCEEKVNGQLQRILKSPEFQATGSQREFLQFVISETLSGRSSDIKGYTVATRVFGRNADFDPNLDPIVSIHANKLRRALERYYLVAGQNDPVRIDIPKGTYVPCFYKHADTEPGNHCGRREWSREKSESAWPTVLVRPFQILTVIPELDYVGTGITAELAVEITRYQEMRVLLYHPETHEGKAFDPDARFVIDGSIRKDSEGVKVAVHLLDRSIGIQIWGDTYRSDQEAAQLISFQENVAREVAVIVCGEYGIVTRTLSAECRSIPPTALRAYEAILRYYEYDLSLTPDSFVRALEALEHARVVEPRCGLVWSMLGRLYGNIYSLELPGFETALEKAIRYSERGVQLNPDNQRTRAVLAFIRMFSNEIPAALAEAERALAINPKSLFILDGIGYLMTLLGEWERGPALIREAMDQNPYYGLYVHYALWVDWVRQGEYEKAFLETFNFSRSSVFWDPLMKAASLGLLDRVEDGKAAVKELLALKPDFEKRGHILIGYYIKFEEIVERVTEGLRKAGLKLQTV